MCPITTRAQNHWVRETIGTILVGGERKSFGIRNIERGLDEGNEASAQVSHLLGRWTTQLRSCDQWKFDLLWERNGR